MFTNRILSRVRRGATITALMTAAAAVACASAGPAAASTADAPGIPGLTLTSTWASGYAAVPIAGGAPAFTSIVAYFTIPGLNCAKTPNATAQFRAGLDGVLDGTIEHVGVSARCAGGAPAAPHPYTAWYQMAPGAVVPEFHPKAGDTLRASVTVGPPGVYTLSMVDLTRPLSFTAHAQCTTCQNSSAQVTAGPPDPGGPGKPPADFGTVNFFNILVTDSAGVSGGLADPHWGTDTMVMPKYPGGYTLAGPLTTGGGPPPTSAFSDVWK